MGTANHSRCCGGGGVRTCGQMWPKHLLVKGGDCYHLDRAYTLLKVVHRSVKHLRWTSLPSLMLCLCGCVHACQSRSVMHWWLLAGILLLTEQPTQLSYWSRRGHIWRQLAQHISCWQGEHIQYLTLYQQPLNGASISLMGNRSHLSEKTNKVVFVSRHRLNVDIGSSPGFSFFFFWKQIRLWCLGFLCDRHHVWKWDQVFAICPLWCNPLLTLAITSDLPVGLGGRGGVWDCLLLKG